MMPVVSCTVLAAGNAELRTPQNDLRDEAAAALHRAVEFFRTEVAIEGGYLWRYSADLSRREGEGRVETATVWVQPPGTPSVGMAYLAAYDATGDPYYLETARETAGPLLRGQLQSGGWTSHVDFDPDERARHRYRNQERVSRRARNYTSLDDDTTQAALRFLMRLDRALGFEDEEIHEAVTYALESLLRAQYPNGAWPQGYAEPHDPAQFPVLRATYPESWSRTPVGGDYWDYYTLNDNTLADTIATMLEAWHVYDDERFRESAERGGDFILLAQMPDPQPAWAQQYDFEMHPAWARRFEPPAISGGESQGVLRVLMRLYRETGEERFLEPIPRAVEYLRASALPDGRLARFYELETNRPLYFNRQYELTYSDDDLPTHYAFQIGNDVEQIAAQYERLRATDLEELRSEATRRPRVTPGLENRVREVIAPLDERGAWVEDGRMRFFPDDDPTRRIIDCRTFVRNVETLSEYLAAGAAE